MSVTGHDPPRPRTLEELRAPVVLLDGQSYPVRTKWLVAFLRLLLARERQAGWQPDRVPAGRLVYSWGEGKGRMRLLPGALAAESAPTEC